MTSTVDYTEEEKNHIRHALADARINACAEETETDARRIFREQIELHLGHPRNWPEFYAGLVREIEIEFGVSGITNWVFN